MSIAIFPCLLIGGKEVGRWSIGESWSSFEWTPDEIKRDYVQKKGDKHICKICGKISTTARTAAEHVLNIHLAGRTKCPLCDRTGTRSAIKMHVLREHNMCLNMYSMKLTKKRI